MVAVLVSVAVLFSYLVLPGVIESRLAANLQERYDLQTEPGVEVSSSFPPELLLGRADRVRVNIDRLRREGFLLRDVRVRLRDVDVSVPSLLRGTPELQTRGGYFRAGVPEAAVNRYLRRQSGLNGRAEISSQGVVYRSPAVPVSGVRLDPRVTGPHRIAVDLGRLGAATTIDLGELPFGARLQSIKPSEEALLVRGGVSGESLSSAPRGSLRLHEAPP